MLLQTRTSSTLLKGLNNPGNRSAWQEFDRRYRPLILEVARRLGLQIVDAEDAAQETMAAFLQAYRRKRFDPERGRLRDWLRGIAVHKIRDLQRKVGRKEKPLPDGAEPASDGREERRVRALWDDACRMAILRQCIEEVRQEVHPRSFEAFHLYTLQQISASKVASRLQVSEEVVYQSKSRILARIRKLLPKMEEIW